MSFAPNWDRYVSDLLSLTTPLQQHFGDTVLHVVDYLLEAGSPLNTDTPWSPMNSVYYSLYDRVYIKYSMQTADLLCLSLLVAFGGLFFTRTATQSRKIYYKAMLGPISDFLVGLLAALTMAVFLRYGLKKGQTWFTHEQLPLIVFGLPVLTGKSGQRRLDFLWLIYRPTAIISKHYLLGPRAATQSEPSHVIEHAFAFASVWHSLAISALLQCLRVKSAYLFANMGLAGLLVLYSNEAVNLFQGKKGEIHFVPVYVLWTAISIVLGTEAATAVSDSPYQISTELTAYRKDSSWIFSFRLSGGESAGKIIRVYCCSLSVHYCAGSEWDV
jgi:hypothetical protein